MPRLSRPALALAVLLTVPACNPVTSAIDQTLAENTPRTAEPGAPTPPGGEPCELVNGPRGCTGAAAVPGAPAAAVATAPTARGPQPFTPADCDRRGLSAMALVWGNLGRGDELTDYCRQVLALRASPAPVPTATAPAGPPAPVAGSCRMTPTCQTQLAARDRLLQRYNAEMGGRGVGAQAGYAWCAATETERAARACAASLRAAGQAACAAQLDASADGARNSARQALDMGRQVGVDASRTVACR